MQIGQMNRMVKRKTGKSFPLTVFQLVNSSRTIFFGTYQPRKQTGDERRQRHQKLRRQIITIGEKILTEEAQALYRSLRKGTEYCDNTTDYCLYPGTLRTTYLALFINKGGTNLVHRDRRGESSQHQQAIEQYRDDVTNHRHIAKSLLEYIRQGDED